VTLASDPITGLGHMLSHDFVQHALLAGTAIAVLSGLVGYFVVLRGQVFAGDALSHVAYAGSLAALAAGVDVRFGLFAACIAVGLVLGLLGGRGVADDVVIGTTFSWILGLGVFFLAIYTTHAATGNGAANVNVLFGSIFGISAGAARTATWIALGCLAVLVAIARPLLFASIDPAVAGARGVPVRLLGPLFLAIVGVTAAEASQAVGALLLFGLVAAPPAAARLLTDRPWHAFLLSGLLAVLAMWVGITVAYAAPALPVSFDVMATATLLYAVAAVVSSRRRRRQTVAPGAGRTPVTATSA
jgi:zinc/manganese transport system permease protein